MRQRLMNLVSHGSIHKSGRSKETCCLVLLLLFSEGCGGVEGLCIQLDMIRPSIVWFRVPAISSNPFWNAKGVGLFSGKSSLWRLHEEPWPVRVEVRGVVTVRIRVLVINSETFIWMFGGHIICHSLNIIALRPHPPLNSSKGCTQQVVLQCTPGLKV